MFVVGPIMCVEWLHSKAFGGPQQTPANVPLSEHHSLVGPPLSLTQGVQWPWLTHCIQPTNRWAALSTGTRRPATLLLSLAALQQFRQHTGELLTLVNALGSPSSLQLLRFLVSHPSRPLASHSSTRAPGGSRTSWLRFPPLHTHTTRYC